MDQIALVIYFVDLPCGPLVEKSERNLFVVASPANQFLKSLILECGVFLRGNLIIYESYSILENFVLP